MPQATVLGSIHFLIYISDNSNITINAKIFCYADDIAILFYGDNWNEVLNDAERGFNET